MSKAHRALIDSIPEQLVDDAGQTFPAAVVVPYAYRHSYAQRHADNGTPPDGVCTEPSNVKAGGHACPYKYSCIGCGHFRSDASHLPELKSYLQQLLADRERILAATDVQGWVRAKTAPSDEEIAQLRGLIRRVENDLDQLSPADQQRIQEAIDVIRSARQKVSLGMPTIGTQEGQT